jgi:hypothetical protein
VSEPEPTTVADLVGQIIAERGGRDRFSAVQARIAHALAGALRDPSNIDAQLVAKLSDLLPAPRLPVEKMIIPSITFVDGEMRVLERALGRAKSKDRAHVALAHAKDRLGKLKSENERLRRQLDDSQRRWEASGVVFESAGVFDARQHTKRIQSHANGNAGHVDNVDNSTRNTGYAVSRSLEERYPSLRWDRM